MISKEECEESTSPSLCSTELITTRRCLGAQKTGKWRYSRLICPLQSSNSPTVVSNLGRASPPPSVGPNSNDANTLIDILDDRFEGLGPHWANGKRHEKGDDSQYNLVVPLDHILADRNGFDRSSLDSVGFYRSVEPNGDTPQSNGNICCAHICPRYQRSFNFVLGNLQVIRTCSVLFVTVDSEESSSKLGPSDPSRSRVGCGICIWRLTCGVGPPKSSSPMNPAWNGKKRARERNLVGFINMEGLDMWERFYMLKFHWRAGS